MNYIIVNISLDLAYVLLNVILNRKIWFGM